MALVQPPDESVDEPDTSAPVFEPLHNEVEHVVGA